MAAEIDPRLKDIMDKLNKSNEPTEKEDEEKQESPREPRTFEEFLEAEHLDEWPYRITCEQVLDLTEEKNCIGSIDNIKEELRKATMLDMTVLNNLENRLRMFEYQVTVAADMLIVEPTSLSDDVLPLPMSVSRTFLTEAKEGDIMKVHPSRKSKKANAGDETHKKSVEHCTFPGFHPGELTELPGQLEAPQILNRVTKAQDFNPGLKRFWKKIFQSEASVAMMQDSFWWIFLEFFDVQKKHKKDQSRLFDRLADSFVALFTSINPEIKDKIFLMYADCLCQSIYVAFVEAFPESLKQFQDNFKLRLVNTVSEWITGQTPSYGSWNHWDMKRLQLPLSTPGLETKVNGTNDRALLQSKESHTLPMAEFNRTIQQLGSQPRMATVASMATNNTALMSRDTMRLTVNTSDDTTGTAVGTNLPPLNTSHQTQWTSPKKAVTESSYMGRGVEVERVLFNLEGRSPLVTHFLHMRQLCQPKTVGRRVRRTQILKPPPGTRTYQDLIQETTETQKKLSKEYNKICNMTQKEINRIERQQRETARRIDELQQSISHCHNSMEIKILKERLFDSKDWENDGPLSSRQATEMKIVMDVGEED